MTSMSPNDHRLLLKLVVVLNCAVPASIRNIKPLSAIELGSLDRETLLPKCLCLLGPRLGGSVTEALPSGFVRLYAPHQGSVRSTSRLIEEATMRFTHLTLHRRHRDLCQRRRSTTLPIGCMTGAQSRCLDIRLPPSCRLGSRSWAPTVPWLKISHEQRASVTGRQPALWVTSYR